MEDLSQSQDPQGDTPTLSDVSPMRRMGSNRPSDSDLLDALVAYRVAPKDAVRRAKLAIVLDAAVQYAIRGRVARFAVLRPFQDDLVHMAWVRLLNQELHDGELLKGYDPEHDADLQKMRSVYAWVWQNCNYAARDQLKELKKQAPNGPEWEVSLSEFEPDNQAEEDDEKMQRTPSQLQLSETPLKASLIRISTLTPWLETLAQEMVGKKLHLTLKDDGKKWVTKWVKFDHSHQDVWRQWLAPNDASEDELAKQIGIGKRTLQRRTDEAYAFMLQHPDFSAYLELMIPNRVRGHGVADADLSAAMSTRLNALDGKVVFRELVQCWLSLRA